MAETTIEIKVPEDIEYRVIGNGFALLIACGGLLAGTMFAERSLEYWAADIVPLSIAVLMAFRLYRNIVTTLTAYPNCAPNKRPSFTKQDIQREHAIVAQLPESSSYSPEQVVEEVVKRIETQKAEAARKAGGGR
ncbi:MAG TPA: hypothetical protein PL053_10920 [Deltaproteobacteria bacterium]|nr:hypothetical protein [Deltaproteobacteria bacterium]